MAWQRYTEAYKRKIKIKRTSPRSSRIIKKKIIINKKKTQTHGIIRAENFSFTPGRNLQVGNSDDRDVV